jgi:hypothetical protein
MTQTNTEVSVVPTQADREAAAQIGGYPNQDLMRNGEYDQHPYIQAVARHRLAHQTPPATQPSATLGARWRPEVVAFADLMERQLRANDHKPGWKHDEPFDLQERVEQEAAELSTAVAEWEGHTGYTEAALSRAVGREAADVGNMAMMVADVCGALHTPPPVATATAVEAARPFSEWHEDHGEVLWWKLPVAQAPYIGSPLDLGRGMKVVVQIGFEEHDLPMTNTGGWPFDEEDEPDLWWTPLPKPTFFRVSPTPPAGDR